MRKYLYAILSLSLLAGFAHAEGNDQPPPQSSEKSSQKKNIKGVHSTFLSPNSCPNAYCKESRPKARGEFVVDAAAVLFQPTVGGTEFAYTIDLSAVNNKGRVYRGEMDWSWGFSVGIGYNTCGCLDHWQIHLGYTRLTANGMNVVTAEAFGPSLVALFASPGIKKTNSAQTDFIFTQKAQLSSQFSFNDIDLSFARSLCVTPKLVLTPATALRGVFINYDQDVRYIDPSLLPSSSDPLNYVLVKGKNDFSGIGPSVDMSANWYFVEKFSLMSKMGASLLYGYMDVNYLEQYSAHDLNDLFLDASSHRFLPSMEFDLGFSYDTCFQNGSKLEINLFWGLEYFWRYNQMLKSLNSALRFDSVSEDLSLQSVKLEASFSF